MSFDVDVAPSVEVNTSADGGRGLASTGPGRESREPTESRKVRDARPTASAESLVVAGIEPFSSCDWPGHLVATVFLQGCPWRCGYCHNTSIIDPRAPGESSWAAVRTVLARRAGLLDGVVFSGGEPTRQAGLADAMGEVLAAGFGVGLHTGGAYPRRVRELVAAGLVDWVGLDIKATPEKFDLVTRTAGSAKPAFETLQILQEAGVAMEVRTTVDPTILTDDDVARLTEHLATLGVTHHVVQKVRTEGAPHDFVERLTQFRREEDLSGGRINPLG